MLICIRVIFLVLLTHTWERFLVALLFVLAFSMINIALCIFIKNIAKLQLQGIYVLSVSVSVSVCLTQKSLSRSLVSVLLLLATVVLESVLKNVVMIVNAMVTRNVVPMVVAIPVFNH